MISKSDFLRLSDTIESVSQNSDKMKKLLDTMKYFLGYTEKNIIFIFSQNPNATDLKTKTQWKNNGFCVKDNEKPIYIIVPNPHKDIKDNSYCTAELYDVSQTKQEQLDSQDDLKTVNSDKADEFNYIHIAYTILCGAEVRLQTVYSTQKNVAVFYNSEKKVIEKSMSYKQNKPNRLLYAYIREACHCCFDRYYRDYTREAYDYHAVCAAYIICSILNVDISFDNRKVPIKQNDILDFLGKIRYVSKRIEEVIKFDSYKQKKES